MSLYDFHLTDRSNIKHVGLGWLLIKFIIHEIGQQQDKKAQFTLMVKRCNDINREDSNQDNAKI